MNIEFRKISLTHLHFMRSINTLSAFNETPAVARCPALLPPLRRHRLVLNWVVRGAGRAGGAPRCQLLSGRRGVNTLDRSSDNSDTDTTWTRNNCNVTHGSDLNMASTVTLLAGMLTLITKSSSGFLIKISEDVSTQNCQEVLSNLEVGLLKICYLFSTSSTIHASSPCCVCVLC